MSDDLEKSVDELFEELNNDEFVVNLTFGDMLDKLEEAMAEDKLYDANKIIRQSLDYTNDPKHTKAVKQELLERRVTISKRLVALWKEKEKIQTDFNEMLDELERLIQAGDDRQANVVIKRSLDFTETPVRKPWVNQQSLDRRVTLSKQLVELCKEKEREQAERQAKVEQKKLALNEQFAQLTACLNKSVAQLEFSAAEKYAAAMQKCKEDVSDLLSPETLKEAKAAEERFAQLKVLQKQMKEQFQLLLTQLDEAVNALNFPAAHSYVQTLYENLDKLSRYCPELLKTYQDALARLEQAKAAEQARIDEEKKKIAAEKEKIQRERARIQAEKERLEREKIEKQKAAEKKKTAPPKKTALQAAMEEVVPRVEQEAKAREEAAHKRARAEIKKQIESNTKGGILLNEKEDVLILTLLGYDYLKQGGGKPNSVELAARCALRADDIAKTDFTKTLVKMLALEVQNAEKKNQEARAKAQTEIKKRIENNTLSGIVLSEEEDVSILISLGYDYLKGGIGKTYSRDFAKRCAHRAGVIAKREFSQKLVKALNLEIASEEQKVSAALKKAQEQQAVRSAAAKAAQKPVAQSAPTKPQPKIDRSELSKPIVVTEEGMGRGYYEPYNREQRKQERKLEKLEEIPDYELYDFQRRELAEHYINGWGCNKKVGKGILEIEKLFKKKGEERDAMLIADALAEGRYVERNLLRAYQLYHTWYGKYLGGASGYKGGCEKKLESLRSKMEAIEKERPEVLQLFPRQYITYNIQYALDQLAREIERETHPRFDSQFRVKVTYDQNLSQSGYDENGKLCCKKIYVVVTVSGSVAAFREIAAQKGYRTYNESKTRNAISVHADDDGEVLWQDTSKMSSRDAVEVYKLRSAVEDAKAQDLSNLETMARNIFIPMANKVIIEFFRNNIFGKGYLAGVVPFKGGYEVSYNIFGVRR